MKILVTGDFCPRDFGDTLDVEKFDAIYKDFTNELNNNDLNITNLECPFYEGNTPIPKIGPNLKADYKYVNLLKSGYFNLVTLANNHIMDHGSEGFETTINHLSKNEIKYVGAGYNIEQAEQFFIYEKNLIKVAIINVCETEFSIAKQGKSGSNPMNIIRTAYQIKEAKKQTDYVVLIAHAGNEHYSLPSKRIKETFRFFIDEGCDVVLSHHTHCYSGYESYNKGMIFYSLGNFIFPIKSTIDKWLEGYMVKLDFEKNNFNWKIIPYKQTPYKIGLMTLTKKERTIFEENIEKINKIIGDDNLLELEWSKFCKRKERYYLLKLEPYEGYFKALKLRNLLPSFLSNKKKLMLFNSIACESHRDALISVLSPDNY